MCRNSDSVTVVAKRQLCVPPIEATSGANCWFLYVTLLSRELIASVGMESYIEQKSNDEKKSELPSMFLMLDSDWNCVVACLATHVSCHTA